MSDQNPTDPDAVEEWSTSEWTIREADHGDARAVAEGIRELLMELGGAPPSLMALEDAARALIDDEDLGTVLIADRDGDVVGVLAASWDHAIRTAGRYSTIQELWVHPVWRGQAIGGELLEALCDVCVERGVMRIEVGLPTSKFRHLEATEAFYSVNDFQIVGTRMRRLL